MPAEECARATRESATGRAMKVTAICGSCSGKAMSRTTPSLNLPQLVNPRAKTRRKRRCFMGLEFCAPRDGGDDGENAVFPDGPGAVFVFIDQGEERIQVVVDVVHAVDEGPGVGLLFFHKRQ